MLGAYYRLTKPGIVYSNVMTAAAGYLLAVSQIHVAKLVASLGGIGLLVASACVVNNYLDRAIDKKMQRTRQRPSANGHIGLRPAMLYAAVLGLGGLVLLSAFTNRVTVILGLLAYFDYVVLYGYSKRHSRYGTLVGSISGALPPAAGYTAVTGQFNATAALLFLILLFWQMPHFYAIAIYRLDDYRAAGLPVWPLAKGLESTKRQMLGYIMAFVAACVALSLAGLTGRLFAVTSVLLGLAWLWRSHQGYAGDERTWARRMFFVSLVVLVITSVGLAAGTRLP